MWKTTWATTRRKKNRPSPRCRPRPHPHPRRRRRKRRRRPRKSRRPGLLRPRKHPRKKPRKRLPPRKRPPKRPPRKLPRKKPRKRLPPRRRPRPRRKRRPGRRLRKRKAGSNFRRTAGPDRQAGRLVSVLSHHRAAPLEELNQDLHLLVRCFRGLAPESGAGGRFANAGGHRNKAHQLQGDFILAHRRPRGGAGLFFFLSHIISKLPVPPYPCQCRLMRAF